MLNTYTDVVDLCAAVPLALQPESTLQEPPQLAVLDLAGEVMVVQVVEGPRLGHGPHPWHRVDHLGGYSALSSDNYPSHKISSGYILPIPTDLP